MKRLHVFLPPQLHDNMRAIAADKGVTFGEVLRRAAEDYVSKAKRKAREASRADAAHPSNVIALPDQSPLQKQ